MKTFTLGIFLLMISCLNLAADINKDTIKVRLSNPRDAVMMHYKYLQEDSYFPEISAKALFLEGQDRKKGKSLALKLKKIFDGRALLIVYSGLSSDPNYIDSTSGRSVFYPFNNHKDIYLEKIGKKWKYSKETVSGIPETYKKLYPFDLQIYVENFPEFFRYQVFFGLEFWHLLSLIILAIAGYLLRQLIRFVVRFILILIFSKTRYKDFLDKHLRPTARTISSITALIIIFQFVPVLQLPIEVHVVADVSYKLIFAILIIVLSFRITDYLHDRLIDVYTNKNNKLRVNLLPFFRTVLKTVVVIIGILGILINLGFDIWPWLAGLSIGGLAIALAAQETIRNIFGSVTIFADRPFDVGDWIIYENFEGTVEEIGIRSTTIRTFNNSIITVPNGKLMDVTIDNMGKREFRRYETYLDMVYNTPVNVIDAYIKGIKRIIENHPDTRKDLYYVYFFGLAASSIQIYVRLWLKVVDFDLELKARHEILQQILELGRTLGVEFAYPTQTLHVEEFPEKKGIRTDLTVRDEELNEKMESFFSNSKKNDDYA